MLFYSIGEALQERAVERARRNIRALVDIRPEQANVLEDGKPVAMPAAQVVPGRTIEVLPGTCPLTAFCCPRRPCSIRRR